MLRSLIGSDSLQDFKNCLGREVHRFLHATLNSYMHLLQIKKYVYIYSYIIYICTYICLYIAVFQLPEEIHMLVLKYYHIQTCSGNNTPKYRETWNFKSISSFSRPLEIQRARMVNKYSSWPISVSLILLIFFYLKYVFHFHNSDINSADSWNDISIISLSKKKYPIKNAL